MHSATVVIPAYNAARTIGPQLDAVVQQAPSDAEICVVDNGSKDPTALEVSRRAKTHPNIRLIIATNRQNAGYARNVGVKATSGKAILFCDADDIVGEGWYSSMSNALERYDMVGGFTEEHLLNDPDILAWRVERDQKRLVVAHGYLQHAIGANCGVTRDMWGRCGGWAECLPSGAGEDVEFSWRVQKHGGILGAVPDSIVHYRHRRSLEELARQYHRRGINSHLVCRVHVDQLGLDAGPPRQPLESERRPGPSTRLTVAARSALSLAPRLMTDRRSQGSLIRQIAYAAGWACEELRYRAKGPTWADEELTALLGAAGQDRISS